MDIRRPCMSWHELVCHMNLSNVWIICGKHDSSTTDVTFWYMISKCSALSLLQTFWSLLGPVLKLKWISMLHLNCCLGGGTFEEVLANINSPLIFELTIYLVWYLKVGFCICFFFVTNINSYWPDNTPSKVKYICNVDKHILKFIFWKWGYFFDKYKFWLLLIFDLTTPQGEPVFLFFSGSFLALQENTKYFDKNTQLTGLSTSELCGELDIVNCANSAFEPIWWIW